MLKKISNLIKKWMSASKCNFCCYLSNSERSTYLEYEGQFKKDLLLEELRKKSNEASNGDISFSGRWEILYILIRMLKPDVIIETGVLHGESTAFILKALHDEGKGKCYSIDLPAVGHNCDEVVLNKGLNTLPEGLDPGWVMPEYLRSRWEIIHGKSREKLEPLLKKLGTIDVFVHDSLHTYENMQWEYSTAWPFLKEGGTLLSHDIFFNNAFKDFCQTKNRKVFHWNDLGGINKND